MKINFESRCLKPLFVALVANVTANDVAGPVLFDTGIRDSPLEAAAVRVTGELLHSQETGFGWVSSQQAAFDRDHPLPEVKHGRNRMRSDLLYPRHAPVLNRDGVGSEGDMRFRFEISPGRYGVQVRFGELYHPRGCLAIECNGKMIAAGISAKHIIGRSILESIGLHMPVRFGVDSEEGNIELRFYGESTETQKNAASYSKWFPGKTRPGSYRANEWKRQIPLKLNPKTPIRPERRYCNRSYSFRTVSICI